MLRSLSTKFSNLKSKASTLSNGLWSYFLKPTSETPKLTDPHSFTVSYLQKSCGFSKKSAISASKKLLIETPEKADSVLEPMRTNGLTQTHIRDIIANRPGLLLADLDDKIRPNMELFKSLGISGNCLAKMLSTRGARLLQCDVVRTVEFFRKHGFSDEKITMMTVKRPRIYVCDSNTVFKPKLEFFMSMGFSEEEVVNFVSSQPQILERSLENQIIPCFELLVRILGTVENIGKALRVYSKVLLRNVENRIEPNLSVLISHGVSEELISRIFMIDPKVLLSSTHRFTKIVDEVEKLGFDPKTMKFVLAVRSMAVMRETGWEQKLEAFQSFGLSRDQVYLAFRLQPWFMLTSEKKIRRVMDFYVNRLKIQPSTICMKPFLVSISLEKRVIPRSLVLELLMSKGLINKDISIFQAFKITEKEFAEKLVRKYQQALPDVVDAYNGKIRRKEFPFVSQMINPCDV